jgi:phage gpG-like protein
MFQTSIALDEFSRQFSAAVTAALTATARAALEEKAAQLRSRAHEQFLTEGAAYGNKWQERKRPAPWPILNRTGRLLLSFTHEGNPEHIEDYDFSNPNRPLLLFGSRVPYAGYHHRGTTHLPARPILTPDLLGGEELP